MDDMIVDIGREYDIRFGEQHPPTGGAEFL
jgi:hypothetical protein